MTTPRVTVPVEPTEAMMCAWHRSAWPQGPEVSPMSQAGLAFKRHYAAMLSAALAPEGGAVRGPGGYLVKDFADGWYWTPNAALDHASGAPVWSVADSRYETDPPALATREEAPAEAGALPEAMRRLAEDAENEAGLGAGMLGGARIAADIRTVLSALRAQPPAREDDREAIERAAYRRGWNDREDDIIERAERIAPPDREDAQPVAGMTVTLVETAPHLPANGSLTIRVWDNHDLPAGTHRLYTHPAPDALRVAVEAFEAITDLSVNLRHGGPDNMDLHGLSEALNAAVDVAHEALAALQAEQGAK